jgi:outer membrane protein OmpA-like peptidoglycan-associated protein
MKLKLKWILGLVTAVIFSLGLNGAQAEEGYPDATLKIRINSVALGFGFSWGDGTLTYKGKDYPVELQGFSLVDIGASKIDAVGRVYNLNNLDDFNGNYAGVDGGLTIAGGANAAALRNQNGVNLVFVSTSRGLEFTFGFSSVIMKVNMPEKAAAAPPPAPTLAPVAAPAEVPAKVRFAADELFDFDQAVLKHGSSRHQLDDFAAKLKTLGYDSINIVGYTDRLGSDIYNNHLSRIRAEVVKNYLVTKGVEPEKIRAEGRGEADPITGNTCKGSERTPTLIACLQPDRRVEIQVSGIRQTK